MKRKVRLTETQLTQIINRIISEQPTTQNDMSCVKEFKFNEKNKSYRVINDKYDGVFKEDGTCQIYYSKSAWIIQDGKWKCENGELVVFDKSQPRKYMGK